ncbi:MAG: hypothetical protein RL030_1827, partial [Pseudomonadota bacterium]
GGGHANEDLVGTRGLKLEFLESRRDLRVA